MAETGDPAEEWGIFDHDDFFGYKVQEYNWLEDVARIARGIRDHGPAFAAWADLHDGAQDMLEQFEEAYLGEYDSPEAWAESVMDDLGIQARLEQELHGDMARYVRIDTGAWVQDAWLSATSPSCTSQVEGCGSSRVGEQTACARGHPPISAVRGCLARQRIETDVVTIGKMDEP